MYSIAQDAQAPRRVPTPVSGVYKLKTTGGTTFGWHRPLFDEISYLFSVR